MTDHKVLRRAMLLTTCALAALIVSACPPPGTTSNDLDCAVRREIAIAPEHPWEKGGVSYMVTFRDGDRFRAWYRADYEIEVFRKGASLVAYAESCDVTRLW